MQAVEEEQLFSGVFWDVPSKSVILRPQLVAQASTGSRSSSSGPGVER
jgi:hypothetical protein